MANAGDVYVKIGADVRGLKQGLGTAHSEFKNFTSGVTGSFSKISKSVFNLRNAIIALGSGIAVKKAFDFAEMGAGIERQRNAFKNLAESAGRDGDQILAAMDKISRGTVSTMDLIGSASRAMLLGIAPDELTNLMEIARASSKATGDTVTKAFDDITLGIGRQSKMILDNLGIIVKVDEANQKYAESLGKEASKLTDTEKRQAFLNATIEAGRKIIQDVGKDYDDTADIIARNRVQFAELKAQISGVFAVVSADLLPSITDTVTRMREWVEANKAVISQNILDWIGKLKSAIEVLTPWIGKVVEGYGQLYDLLQKIRGLPTRSEADLNLIKKETEALQKQIRLRNMPELQVSMDSRRAELPDLDPLPQTLKNEVTAMNSAMDESMVKAEKGTEKVKNGLEALDKEVRYKVDDFGLLGDTTDTVFEEMKSAVNGWASNFSRTMTDMLFGAEVTFQSIAESFAKMITQMLLQKTVIEPFMGSFFNLLNVGQASFGGGGGGGGFLSSLFGGAGKGNPLIGMTSPGSFGNLLPSFGDGGTVPGPIGAPVLAMVHGGEDIIPAGERIEGSSQPIRLQVILNNPIDPRVFQKSDEEIVTVVADQYARGSIITDVIRRDVGGGG